MVSSSTFLSVFLQAQQYVAQARFCVLQGLKLFLEEGAKINNHSGFKPTACMPVVTLLSRVTRCYIILDLSFVARPTRIALKNDCARRCYIAALPQSSKMPQTSREAA